MIVLVLFFVGITMAEVNADRWDDEYQDILDDGRDRDEKKDELVEASDNGQSWREASSWLSIALFIWLGVLGLLLVLSPWKVEEPRER